MKQYSEKTAAAVIGSMLKRTQKEDKREALWYSWIDADGRQCAIDGFRAFRLSVPVAGLPEMPEDCTPIDLAKVWPDLAQFRELEKPRLAELEALIAYDKHHEAQRRFTYSFGRGLPVLNVHYLRDALRVFPDCRLFYKDIITPVVVTSAHGDGIILPIRTADHLQERREIIWNLPTFAEMFAV